ncbi:hypothetical protein PG999_003716 [Apiospora kogelbergensis]|uniref:Uncharacterized protein n=1 Tax=Apiospora kogelbergensis TaxID=1337665 RepID=A0AAW0R491_9PEZI
MSAAAKARVVEVARKYKDYLAEAGFVDIVEAKYKFIGNPWPRIERDKKLGMYIEIIGDGLGESVNAIVTQAQKDLRDRSIHF